MNRDEKKQKFIELAGLIKDTGEAYAQLLVTGDNKLIEKIYELETKGDEIQDMLDRDFAAQKQIPYLAIDRAKLLRRMDDTLDEIKLAVDNYGIYAKHLPNDFKDKIKALGDNLVVIVSKLAKAIETIYTSFEGALQIVHEIENVRDKGLKYAYDLQAEYFDSLTDWKQYTSVSNVVKRTVSAIAVTKSTSEILTLMAFKYD